MDTAARENGLYQDIIDSWIGQRNDERQAQRGSDTGEWHPSSMTGCYRAAVYAYKGYEPSDDKEMRSIRIMDRGTEMHEIVQSLLADHEFLPEVKVDYAGIKGSCDGLLEVGQAAMGADPDVLSPMYEVQEYKSISPMGKRYMKGAKPEHVKQARIYHRCLREQGYYVIDTIRIVYFDRDDWSVEEYEVPAWTDEEWQAFLGDLADLEDHVTDGTLPDRMPLDSKGKKYWLCNYCDYRTRCWEVDN